jgi:predicted metalloprotease with PDZ domain
VTDGKKSLHDLMRAMFAHSSSERGFTTNDVERLAREVCGCNLKPFFDAYVRGASMIDLDNYLKLVGLRMDVQHKKASSPDGTFIPDRRVRASLSSGGAPILSFIQAALEVIRDGTARQVTFPWNRTISRK